MRVIVDESTGSAVASWLSSVEHDVVSIRDMLPRLPDDQILEMAVRADRVIITNDKDFGELVFRERRPHRGIVLLRLSNNRIRAKIAALERFLADVPHDMAECFVVVTERSIRVTRSGE